MDNLGIFINSVVFAGVFLLFYLRPQGNSVNSKHTSKIFDHIIISTVADLIKVT